MSRKSDISLAWEIYQREYVKDPARTPYLVIGIALEAAYDMGRAAQAEKNANFLRYFEDITRLKEFAKRLRAKVRKMTEGQ